MKHIFVKVIEVEDILPRASINWLLKNVSCCSVTGKRASDLKRELRAQVEEFYENIREVIQHLKRKHARELRLLKSVTSPRKRRYKHIGVAPASSRRDTLKTVQDEFGKLNSEARA